jgi:hypothetical protein
MKEAFLSFREFQWDAPYLHIELRASNGSTCGTQEFYCRSGELEAFGRQLRSFPASVASEVRLEIGKRDAGWAHFVLVRAYVYDDAGHTALEIEVMNQFEKPHAQAAQFSIVCEAASLNRLGKELLAWCENRKNPLEWRPVG